MNNFFITLSLFSICIPIISLERFSSKLFDTNGEQIQECDDRDRWIIVKLEDFTLLLKNAHQHIDPKSLDLFDIGTKILDNTIKVEHGEVLLTQKEFFAGLIQYLPWDGEIHHSPAFIDVLIDRMPRRLNISTVNFWFPNNIKIDTLP